MSRGLIRMLTFAMLLALAVVPAHAKIQLTMVTELTTVERNALLTQYVEEYNRIQNDVEIILNADPGATSPDQIVLWAATGMMPDIMPVSQVRIPQYVQSGLIAPMPTDVVEKLREIYLPGALQLTEHNGQIWGYPTQNMPNAFTYDLVDFRNRGIDESFPETWSGLVEVARLLTTYNSAGDITRAGLGWNQDFRRNIGLLMALTWAEGGELFTDNDRSVNFLSEPVLNAVDFLDDIINRQNIYRSGGSHHHNIQAIRWAPGPYIRSTIYDQAGPERFEDFRSGRIPVGQNGERMVANYGWVITVPTATPHKKEVHDFLQWITSDITPHGTTRMGDVMAILGSIPNTVPDVMHQGVLEDPFMQGFVAPMMDGQVRSWPMPPNSSPVFTAINNALVAIFNRDGAPRNILENLQQEAQQLINDARDQ